MIRAAILAACVATPAVAQQCGPTEALSAFLGREYDEWPVARGLSQSGDAIVQIWANLETGTWTLVVVRPDGMSCMALTGQAFGMLERPPQGEPM